MRHHQPSPITGLVFVSPKPPELDSFAWCDNWQESNYLEWLNRKKASRQPWRAHEPIGFINGTGPYVQMKLKQPRRARYVTLKLSTTNFSGAGLVLERIKFSCIPATHPLGALLGTPLLDVRARELKDELLKTALAVSADKRWTLQQDEELVSMVQTLCSKIGVQPSVLDSAMLSPGADELIRFKSLADLPTTVLRARFAIIKYLNRLVTPLLHYVDIKLYKPHKTVEAAASESKTAADGTVMPALLSFDDNSLSYIVHQLKGLYFMSTKKSVLDALLAFGSAKRQIQMQHSGFQRPSTRVSINRMKALKSKENRAKDPDGLKSVFGQLYSQVSQTPYESLRGYKNQQMFQVTFLGEGSIDVGGPYRECIANACADLMSENTPLCIPCPNRKNSVGLNREKWLPNPSARSATHLSMFEFLGALMGVALRTGETLALDLPSAVWKKLLGISTDVSDLEAVDKLCVQAFGEMQKLSADKFEYLVQAERFVTQLSDGREIEVKEGGRDVAVTFANRDEYVQLCVQARLNEADQQINAIRKGLHAVVPAYLLGLFSWFDLEMLVCGNAQIDVDALRKHTLYRGLSAGSPLVKNFWRAMESFNTEERQMFLRFVWGRSRLPVTDSDWTQNFTLHALKAGDDKLPISHTCFFSLDLPNYSTYEILRQKLLFACFNCMAIDIDFNPDASSLNNFVDTD